MKNLLIFAITTLLLFSACGEQNSENLEQDEENEIKNNETKEPEIEEDFAFSEKIPEEKINEKDLNLENDMLENLHSGGSFTIVAQTLDDVDYLMLTLGDYYKKRYTDEEIAKNFRKEYKEFQSLVGGGFPMLVVLSHTGGYSNDETLIVNDKTYEFFFLENEKGDYIEAKGQYTEGFYLNELNNISPPIELFITFPEDELEEMMQNSEKLYLTFDGLDILPEYEIELTYPVIKNYIEEYPEVETMIKEIEGT